MRGRKTKPTHLRLLEGNRGHRALNEQEPKPEGDLKDCPEWMTESQKSGWNYAITHAPKGMLKKIDQSALVVWVVAEDVHRQATEKLTHGLIMKAPNTGLPIQSPYLPIVNKQASIMLKAAEQLGFTPASRPRIKADIDNDWDEEKGEVSDAKERLAHLIAKQTKQK